MNRKRGRPPCPDHPLFLKQHFNPTFGSLHLKINVGVCGRKISIRHDLSLNLNGGNALEVDALHFTDLLFISPLTRMLLEELAHIFLALAETLTVVGVPCARLFQHIELGTDVDDFTEAGNAFAIKDVKLCLLERRQQPCS